MTSLMNAPRVLHSSSVAMFTILALLGVLSQPPAVHLLYITLLLVVTLGTLITPRGPSALAGWGVAILLHGAALLWGSEPVGDGRTLLTAGVLFALMAITGWLLSRRVAYLERTLYEQNTLIQQLTIIDQATGALRTPYLHNLLVREVARARRYQQPFSLLALAPAQELEESDPQHAALGHLLYETLRDVDRVGFAPSGAWLLILPHTPIDGAQVVAQRLHRLAQAQLHLELYCGIAQFPDDGIDADTLRDEAQAALEFARMNQLPIASTTALAS